MIEGAKRMNFLINLVFLLSTVSALCSCKKVYISADPISQGSVTVSPTQAQEIGFIEGSSVLPLADTVYTITNSGGSSINWDTSVDSDWVTITPSNGALSGNSSTEVVVNLNSNMLWMPEGTVTSHITFSNLSTQTTIGVRNIDLIINKMPYTSWTNGPNPTNDPSWFPVGVWLQDSSSAVGHKANGINISFDIWHRYARSGMTTADLDVFTSAGMKVICYQNPDAYHYAQGPNGNTIISWFGSEEPDDAQSEGWDEIGVTKRWDSCIYTQYTYHRDYLQARDMDQGRRPVAIVFGGMGILDTTGWWVGRGSRTGHPEDYPGDPTTTPPLRGYVDSGDILTQNIYPITSTRSQVAGNVHMVGDATAKLVTDGGGKPVWSFIECTHINNPNVLPTPTQIREEAWMAVIHGAVGIIWFVHEWKPSFAENGLARYPANQTEVAFTNDRLQYLSPMIHAPETPSAATINVTTGNQGDIKYMVRRTDNGTYVFTINRTQNNVTADITFHAVSATQSAEEQLDGSDIPLVNGKLTQQYGSYDVHIWAVK